MATDDDEPTTVFIKFMRETHNIGIIDPEKISIVLVNRVIHIVFEKNLSFDKSFKLTLTHPWDNDYPNIGSDNNLFLAWSFYNHYGFYEIYPDMRIISKPANSSARKSIFQQPFTNATTKTFH